MINNWACLIFFFFFALLKWGEGLQNQHSLGNPWAAALLACSRACKVINNSILKPPQLAFTIEKDELVTDVTLEVSSVPFSSLLICFVFVYFCKKLEIQAGH